MKGRIHDISPEITEDIAVWPGDVPFSRSVSLAISRGDSIDLSAITTTVHVGAHTDSPSHYHADGTGIGVRPLEPYLGACQVIAIDLPRGSRIEPVHLGVEVDAPRVLFKTGSFPDPDQFNEDFVSLSGALVEQLHERGVVLVGIDTPSIDPCHDKVLESHQAVARHDMCILEGIVLADIAPGEYTLVALPLRIRDADASPVRAVLIEP